MSNKISAMLIRLDYYRIKKEVPSYRLGQHFCNVVGLRNTHIRSVDLFTVEDDTLANNLFYEIITDNCWAALDLPIFGEYDISTIKPC